MSVALSRAMVAVRKKKPGLYANIQAKRERIAHGSGEHMRRKGDPGAPSAGQFEAAAKTNAASKAKKRSAAAKKAAKTRAARKAPKTTSS